MTYMECVVNALSTTEAVEVFKGVGGVLNRGIVSPGQFVHVPISAMILERTLGSNHVFGIRTMCLPPAQSAVFSSFCNTVKQAIDKHYLEVMKLIMPAVKETAKKTKPGNAGTEIDGPQSQLWKLDSGNCDVIQTLKTFDKIMAVPMVRSC